MPSLHREIKFCRAGGHAPPSWAQVYRSFDRRFAQGGDDSIFGGEVRLVTSIVASTAMQSAVTVARVTPDEARRLARRKAAPKASMPQKKYVPVGPWALDFLAQLPTFER